MYEFICDYERWRKFDKEYKNRYEMFVKFSADCLKSCNGNQDCFDKCRRPLLDIERFNLGMVKKLSSDIYEICSSKINLDNSEILYKDIEKIKLCCKELFDENIGMVKIETLSRMDDMIRFLNI